MQLRIVSSQGQTTDRVVEANVVRLGRDPACEVAFDAAAYPKVSGEHARVERTASGLILKPRSKTNKTLLNGRPISQSAALKVGDRIRLGYTGPTIEIVSLAGTSKVKVGPTVQGKLQHLKLLRGSLAVKGFEVCAGGIVGREKGAVQFLLDHPHVSRRHASLTVDDEGVVLRDLGSTNGTHVNGRLISEPTLLQAGDCIDVGPFSLRFDGEALVSRSRSNNVELVCRKLERVVKDRATGDPLVLLQDITLAIRPREFVCLLGPSGSGKSTLLAMLSGRNAPDGGWVTINNEDLYDNFEALKRDMAVVPQKDVLHDSLTVGKALNFTAQLRLPSDTSHAERETNVADILEVVGLSNWRDTPIRHLSGGQVKRVSLANELVARPSLLFIDEATSGLDERADREMMELFRQIADSGKTVVCITHNLANIEETCHLLVILTEGGRLAFVGTPQEAKSYFGLTRLGDVYHKLGERKPEEWRAAFQSSSFFIRYIRDRITVEAELADEARKDRQRDDRPAVDALRQTWILICRYVCIWKGDLQALLTMLGQGLLVAVLIGMVFGKLNAVENPFERAKQTVNLFFLLNVSCFWLGCNNAVKEFVKERVIFKREWDYNLRIDSYFTSKFIVLVLIALTQVTFLFGIVQLWCDPAGEAVWRCATLMVLAIAGTMLGLLISALAKTEEVAVALVPLAILPQIILAGVIFPLKGLGKVVANSLITVRWAEHAAESLLPDQEMALLQLDRVSYLGQVTMVAAHALVFAAVTLVMLRRQVHSVKS